MCGAFLHVWDITVHAQCVCDFFCVGILLSGHVTFQWYKSFLQTPLDKKVVFPGQILVLRHQ